MSRCKKLGLLPACLLGIVAVLLLTAVICLALTPAYLRGMLPTETGPACAAAAVGLAVFAVVLLLSGLRGRQAMPTAGGVAGGTILLAALICALGGKGFDFGPWIFRLAACAAAGGVIGAVMSIRPRARSRRVYRR